MHFASSRVTTLPGDSITQGASSTSLNSGESSMALGISHFSCSCFLCLYKSTKCVAHFFGWVVIFHLPNILGWYKRNLDLIPIKIFSHVIVILSSVLVRHFWGWYALCGLHWLSRSKSYWSTSSVNKQCRYLELF